MPYLLIQTNVEVPETTEKALLSEASGMVAQQLGKPEQYMMVAIAPRRRMLFAGSCAPAAFLSLQSIGLPESKLGTMTSSLCDLMGKHIGVPADRVYITFSNVEAKCWGHDGATFG